MSVTVNVEEVVVEAVEVEVVEVEVVEVVEVVGAALFVTQSIILCPMDCSSCCSFCSSWCRASSHSKASVHGVLPSKMVVLSWASILWDK